MSPSGNRSVISVIWDTYPSFQAAIRELLRLSPEQLTALPTISDADALQLDPGVFRLVRSAYVSLLSARVDPDALLSELELLAVPRVATANDFGARRDALLEILRSTPPEESDARLEDLPIPLPILEFAQVDVGLRYVSEDLEAPPRLLPSLTVRLNFDEPAQGADYVVFHLPEESLDRVLSLLRRAQEQLAALRKHLEIPPNG